MKVGFTLVIAAQISSCGDGGMQTTVAVYGDSSCSAPPQTMTISRLSSCTPQVDQVEAVCATEMVHFVKDCVHYHSGTWDDYGVIYDTFGRNTSFLIEEEFDTDVGWCGDNNAFTNASVYLLDESCHTNIGGTTSTKFTIGHSLILKKYDDPTCTTAVNTTEITQAMLSHRSCLYNRRRFYLGGPSTSLTSVAVFEDSSCSAKPVTLKFTRGFVCKPSQNSVQVVCVPDGATHYSISSCFNNYFEFASTVFGDKTPHIIVEEFSEYYCSLSHTVSVYTADGACHSNTDDTTSFKATLASEGTATITSYSDTYCNVVQESIEVSRQMLTSYMCVSGQGCQSEDDQGCGRKFSVGGLGGPPALGRMTSSEIYKSYDCSQPAQSVTINRELSCTPQRNHWEPVCEDSKALYIVKDCINYYPGGWDPYGVIYNAFGPDTPFLLVEEYDSRIGQCGDHKALINATAHLLDENCHQSLAGTSTKLTIGHSLILTKYDDPDCMTAVSATEVTQAMVKEEICIDNARRYLGGPRPSLTAVAIFDDSSCLKSPIVLSFTQNFVCGANRDPTTTVCTCMSNGATHYSILSCSDNYFELTASVFGNKTPYIVVEEFSGPSCSKPVQSVHVYTADGYCHPNTEGDSSFKATLTVDGTAMITIYSDTRCDAVDRNMIVYKQMPTSSACVSELDCIWDDECGCGKRFTIGGLDVGNDEVTTCEEIEFPGWLGNKHDDV